MLLLSRQLPDAVPLPAEAQGFFLNVFQKAIQAPSVDALRSVYCMLNGACRGLHSLLPSDVRRKFDAGLCGILKTNAPGESSMLLSWVCGIVFATEHPEGITGMQTASASEQPVSTESLQQQWKTVSGQKLFGSMSYLYKTISLVCTNVMKIIYNGATDDDAAEVIRIASRVLQFVDQDVKDSWARQERITAEGARSGDDQCDEEHQRRIGSVLAHEPWQDHGRSGLECDGSFLPMVSSLSMHLGGVV